MASIEELAAALRSIATPGMKPKAMRAAIRERHPEASKREIVRAAFYAVALTPSAGEETSAELHDFALAERGCDENADRIVKVSRRRKKHRQPDRADAGGAR